MIWILLELFKTSSNENWKYLKNNGDENDNKDEMNKLLDIKLYRDIELDEIMGVRTNTNVNAIVNVNDRKKCKCKY